MHRNLPRDGKSGIRPAPWRAMVARMIGGLAHARPARSEWIDAAPPK
jgi:hypothetical protein